MIALYGRDEILHRLRSALTATRSGAFPEALALTGPSGYGKTALLSAFAEHVKATREAVVFFCTGRAASTPGAALRASLDAAWYDLKVRFPEHVSGLELLAPSSVSESSVSTLCTGFVRLCESLAQDVPVLLELDDADLADDQTRETFIAASRSRSAHRVLAVFASRSHLAFPGDIRSAEILVNELDPVALRALAKEQYPSASEEILTAIVACAAGNPLDAIFLGERAAESLATTSHDLAASLDLAVRQTLRTLPQNGRDLLSSLSMLREPIPYELIRRLAPSETLDALRAIVPRFVIQRDEGFEFAHARLKHAVYNAIEVRAPYQERVLGALDALSSPSLAQRLDAVDCAARLGDAKSAATRARIAGRQAVEERLFSIAVDIFRRALDWDERAFYGDIDACLAYSDALKLLTLDESAELFLTAAVGRLGDDPPAGSGKLVRALMNVTWSLHGIARALAIYERFRSELTGRDLDEALSAAINLRLQSGDFSTLDDPELTRLITSGEPAVQSRLLATRALISVRQGRAVEAAADLAAQLLAAQRSSVGREYDPYVRFTCLIHEHGPVAAKGAFALRGAPAGTSVNAEQLFYIGLADLAIGRWHETLAAIELSLPTANRRTRDLLLTVAAAIIGFGGEHSSLANIVEQRVASIVRIKEESDGGAIAAWWAASPLRAPSPELIGYVEWWSRLPHSFEIDDVPFDFAFAFIEHKHRNVRLAAASGGSTWLRTASTFRQALVSGDRSGVRAAADGFRALGAHALCALAARAADVTDQRDIALLDVIAPTAKGATARLTARELEVCELVSKGLTNRQIGERLFVSERTVATHVANAFAKLDVRTRTELSSKLPFFYSGAASRA